MAVPADFATAYAECAPAVRAWASVRARGPLGTWFEPDDLVQELSYQAWRAFPSFDPERGSFRPWLFGIANRIVLHLLRGAARAHDNAGPLALLESHADTVPDDLTTISRRVARDETLERFAAYVQTLDELDRDLVVYRGLEQLPHERIAELLGLSLEATKKRWQRLRDELRETPVAKHLLETSRPGS